MPPNFAGVRHFEATIFSYQGFDLVSAKRQSWCSQQLHRHLWWITFYGSMHLNKSEVDVIATIPDRYQILKIFIWSKNLIFSVEYINIIQYFVTNHMNTMKCLQWQAVFSLIRTTIYIILANNPYYKTAYRSTIYHHTIICLKFPSIMCQSILKENSLTLLIQNLQKIL